MLSGGEKLNSVRASNVCRDTKERCNHCGYFFVGLINGQDNTEDRGCGKNAPRPIVRDRRARTNLLRACKLAGWRERTLPRRQSLNCEQCLGGPMRQADSWGLLAASITRCCTLLGTGS